MSGVRTIKAYCAGRPVELTLRSVPADHRRVRCPSCGAKQGLDCIAVDTRAVLYAGHRARVAAAELLETALRP